VRELRGVAASPGVAVGVVRRLDPVSSAADEQHLPQAQRAAAVEVALAALSASAAQLDELAAELRRRDRSAEAELVETGVLMAGDPGLRDAVIAAIEVDGRSAAGAILAAAGSFAETLAALDSTFLAARAADVRSLGRRAARIAAAHVPGANGASPDRGAGHADSVLIADDLGPADVAELGSEVRAIVLTGGGVTAHAAIVARSLGLPAVVAVGDVLFGVPDGSCVLVDGGAGTVLIDPPSDVLETARSTVSTALRLRDQAAATRNLPSVTSDGQLVHVLANVSSAAEVARALDEGAEGVGLLRTELGLLEVDAWPSLDQHRRMLAPILQLLAGRTATVRLMDFGGDKLPPFLAGHTGRGVQLLREAPQAVADQLEAILTAGAATDLAVLIPMVIEPDDVGFVRGLLGALLESEQPRPPVRVGAMVEVPAAVAMVRLIAPCVDFLSIGTNDLTHFHLGLERTTTRAAPAHHPAVLRLIKETVDAACEVGIPVAVCGESASHPVAMPLLVGLGVKELSVGAARVGEVRRWVRRLELSQCAVVAERAMGAHSAADVEELSAGLRASLLVD
jgi:phosphoenolpyruvate-protein phosphotransferase